MTRGLTSVRLPRISSGDAVREHGGASDEALPDAPYDHVAQIPVRVMSPIAHRARCAFDTEPQRAWVSSPPTFAKTSGDGVLGELPSGLRAPSLSLALFDMLDVRPPPLPPRRPAVGRHRTLRRALLDAGDERGAEAARPSGDGGGAEDRPAEQPAVAQLPASPSPPFSHCSRGRRFVVAAAQANP